jgi:alkylation response protein AidB-like acyl-CoA dehydrogenase
MEALLADAVAYAKERMAFGRPIGSFQAVKHLLADASLRVEMARAVADAAALAVSDGRPDAPEVVSIAKSFVADAGIEVAHAAWQTYGGVAYRWDHHLHLYLRRLTTDAALYGSADWHREQILCLHGL